MTVGADPRIELLSRIVFVQKHHRAAIAFAQTPWVQVARIFGVIQTSKGELPILIQHEPSSTRNDVFVFRRNRWSKLSDVRIPELDPGVVRACAQSLAEKIR